MDKEFISLEEALTLRKLGFDEECLGYFNDEGRFCYTSNPWNATKEKGMMNNPASAPTYSQVFRWFRNTHKLSGEILSHQFYFKYQIIFDSRGCNTCRDILSNFNTYEEAEHACLNALIDKTYEESEQNNLNKLI